MATYNTGTTFSATNITAATAFTGTIPAGVAVGDVMIVSVNVFSFSQATASVSTPTSGGGAWTQIGTLLTGSQGSVTGWASAWYRVATAGDAGSTFSMSWTGSTGAGNQFWWAADLEAYTGFYTASPIGNFNTVVSSGTTVVAPSTTTARASSWAVYTCPTSVSGSGTITGAPTTSRHIINPGAGVDNAISDSAGSVGGAGTAIGGGTFTLSASSSGDGISFTIELCTVAPVSLTAQTTPPRIPHPLWFELLEVAQARADWQAQGVASLQTQHWRLMDGASGRPGTGSTGTQPPAAATANSGNLVPGLSFYVTAGGMWFEGYWWYVTASGGQSTAPQKFALWSDAPASASGGTVVPGTVVTSGTLAAGWNWVPLPQPVQLALYSVYVAATTANSGPFPETAGQFSSGGPYAAGITSGPLACFSDANGGNAPPSGYVGNGCLTTAGSDPALVMPATDAANAGDLLWLDVQVTNTAPAGYQGSYRLWPNTLDADYATAADAAFNYTIATEIKLAQPCVVNAIWYYIPTGQGSSNNQWATSADIWNVRTGVRVATQPAPTWIKPFTGGIDGNSNSGRWVYTQMPGTVTLPAGDYYVSVYNSNGSPNGWGAKRLGYWQAYNQAPAGTFTSSPPGAAGITSGPLYAPATPAASTAHQYNGSNPGATPPYSDGVIEPGQSVFAQGPPNQVPYLYVDALFQNYWIDLEVTPAALYQPGAPDLPQRLPHPLYTRLLEVAGYRMEGKTPPQSYGQAMAASAVMSGSVQRGAATGLPASAAVTGGVARNAARALAAALLVTTAVARGTGRTLAAAAAMAAAVARNPAKTLSAGLAAAAAVARNPGKLLAGTLAAAGTVRSQAAKALSGTAAASGTLARGIGRMLSAPGSLASSLLAGSGHLLTLPASASLTGAITALKVRLLVFTGSLTASGALARNAGKALSAAAGLAASARRQCGKALGAGLSAAGSLGRGLGRKLAAALGLAGTGGFGRGGTNYPVTFSTRAVLGAAIVTAAGRLAHLFALGAGRLRWAAGAARTFWSSGRARRG